MKDYKVRFYTFLIAVLAMVSTASKAQILPFPPPPPLPLPGLPILNDLSAKNFVRAYYNAYSGVPKAERLLPFYAENVVIEDPTFDWKGEGAQAIFKNFDKNNELNYYSWRIDQQVLQGNVLVVEGLLQAKYGDVPYEMRFVNIFHVQQGKIIRQYDYFDNKDWYKAKAEWEQGKNKTGGE